MVIETIGLLLKKLVRFIVFTSFFLALCAVMMVYLTYVVFHLQPDYLFLAFTFCGTLCSYNFHWYLTPQSYSGSKKAAWSVRNKRLHLALSIAGGLGAAFFGVQLLQHWQWLATTAFLTFLYSAPLIPHPAARWLQKIAIGKTLFLAFAWTHITSLLPIVLQQPIISDAEVVYVVQRFFLIYSICILFDYRDREQDLRQGIRSVITAFEPAGVHRFFWGNIIAILLWSVALFYFHFHWTTVAALALPGIAVAALSDYSLRHPGDFLFYGVLDGLMALSLPLLLLFQWWS